MMGLSKLQISSTWADPVPGKLRLLDAQKIQQLEELQLLGCPNTTEKMLLKQLMVMMRMTMMLTFVTSISKK